MQEINGRPYSESSIRKMDLVSPLLPWVKVNEGNRGSMFNQEEYEINGHLYGKLKRGTYLILLTSAESTTADFTDQVRFLLRLIAPNITITPLLPVNIDISPESKIASWTVANTDRTAPDNIRPAESLIEPEPEFKPEVKPEHRP